MNSQQRVTAPSPASSSCYVRTTQPSGDNTPRGALEPPIEDTPYEGESSFNARSAETSRLLQRGIDTPEQSSRSHDGLFASKSFARLHPNDGICSHAQFDPGLPMPSQNLILKAVRVARGNHYRHSLGHLLTMSIRTQAALDAFYCAL